MIINLDGNTINNKQKLFAELKSQLKNEEFIGNNLDALEEVIATMKEEIKIYIKNFEMFQNNFGNYSNALVNLFQHYGIEVITK